jgi:hypothetical protein
MDPIQTMRKARCRSLISGLLVVLYVFVLALAQSEALHHAFHADASEPQHECVATLLNSGQVDVAAAPATVWVAASICVSVLLAQPVPFSSTDYFLLPGRGPPCLLSSTPVVG